MQGTQRTRRHTGVPPGRTPCSHIEVVDFADYHFGSPPGYHKTNGIARVNSGRFPIGLWYCDPSGGGCSEGAPPASLRGLGSPPTRGGAPRPPPGGKSRRGGVAYTA